MAKAIIETTYVTTTTVEIPDGVADKREWLSYRADEIAANTTMDDLEWAGTLCTEEDGTEIVDW